MVKCHFPIALNTNLDQRPKNVLKKFRDEKDYFISKNSFFIREITIGPFKSKVDLKIEICDFRFLYFKMNKIVKTCEKDKNNNYYFNIKFVDKFEINSDIKISVAGGGLEFYIWANLWYSCYRRLKDFLDKSKDNEEVFNLFNIFV